MRLRPEQREYLRITEAIADAIEDRHGPLDGAICSKLNISGNAGLFETEINGVIYEVTIIEHGKLRLGLRPCPKCKGRGYVNRKGFTIATCPRCGGKCVVSRAKR